MRFAVYVGDFADLGSCAGVDQSAADQVGDVDCAVFEGGAFGFGDGDFESAQGFDVVDRVDAGELQDDAALVKPVALEIYGTWSGFRA